MPADDRYGHVRKYMNINHSSKGHTGSDSRVHAMSRQVKHGYNYRKLSCKWKVHLPLGSKSGDAKQDLILIFPQLFEGIERLPSEYRIDV